MNMITLHLCLLVNHLWCEISVRIIWRNTHNYNIINLCTLIACLPTESKEILSKNGLNIPLTLKLLFDYASFCKVLSFDRIYYKLEEFLKFISLENFRDYTYLLSQELFKLFFNQIHSLKRLELCNNSRLVFNLYPGAKYCLKDLSELHCNSYISSEFFYQLSQICNNILSLDFISSDLFISKGLIDLISTQKNLKCLSIYLQMNSDGDLKNIISSLANPNKISKLCFDTEIHYSSLSFIAEFSNLQELELIFPTSDSFTDFKKLQYAFFPKLQILKIQSACPKYGILIKFLENNGKHLRECYICN
ncbi:hypothetical protein C1645_840745 [Glomus cerebriforme]|uniref:F-box domain-containing protein n=1 Tax=Glomus cerebriforme TaxID=658196 RepID=A0A397S3N7_9GLOM|nr:hypothetical protein C1645_840745 [Glomus cerebriforme]